MSIPPENENRETVAKGSCIVDPSIVSRMQATVCGQTDEALNAQFGLSYNTWRKLLAGQPIRKSLASRLESRMRQCQDA